MCQLLFNLNDPDLTRGELVEVLEDEVHPGTAIVPWPNWDGPPVDGWRIIILRGVPASRWRQLVAPELDRDGLMLRLRTMEVALTPLQESALEGERTIELQEADVATRDSQRSTITRTPQ